MDALGGHTVRRDVVGQPPAHRQHPGRCLVDGQLAITAAIYAAPSQCAEVRHAVRPEVVEQQVVAEVLHDEVRAVEPAQIVDLEYGRNVAVRSYSALQAPLGDVDGEPAVPPLRVPLAVASPRRQIAQRAPDRRGERRVVVDDLDVIGDCRSELPRRPRPSRGRVVAPLAGKADRHIGFSPTAGPAHCAAQYVNTHDEGPVMSGSTSPALPLARLVVSRS